MITRSRNSITAFNQRVEEYDNWFSRYPDIYQAEVKAIRDVLPFSTRAIEIGVGTGRFACPLGVSFGVDPALRTLQRARDEGISVCCATGEALPFPDGIFDLVLIVTVLCFADDPERMLSEAKRVLQPGGMLVIGFIEKTSHLGQKYQTTKHDDPFFRYARLFSTKEIISLLKDIGIRQLEFRQTLLPGTGTDAQDLTITPGYDRGGFVAVRGRVPG